MKLSEYDEVISAFVFDIGDLRQVIFATSPVNGQKINSVIFTLTIISYGQLWTIREKNALPTPPKLI